MDPLLAAIAAVAAALFLWQLGTSSFFLDEAASMQTATGRLEDLLRNVEDRENTPPGHYLLLHAWIRLAGSQAEWAVRLPSALAAVLLVPVVWRLGTLIGDRRVAVVAALLCATSPLVLQYAQQARAYAIAMLLVAVAVAAGIEASRRESRRSLVVAGVASAAALAMHYMAVFVIAPLCVWTLLRSRLAIRDRLAFCALGAVAWAVWVPLAVGQRRDHPGAHLGPYGTFTFDHLVAVVGAPFDDRTDEPLTWLRYVAAAVVLVSLAAAARRLARRPDPVLLLMGVLVVAPLIVVIAVAGLGPEVLNSRYMALAAPFLLVVVAVGIVELPRPLAAGALALLLATSVAGLAASHTRSGFYPDARGVAATVKRDRQPGDVLLNAAGFGVDPPLAYYAGRAVPGLPLLRPTDRSAMPNARQARRVWVVALETRQGLALLRQVDARSRRLLIIRRFDGIAPLVLLLAGPPTGSR